MIRYAWSVVAMLVVGTVGAQAQPVTIKLKERGEGETVLVKKRETVTSKFNVTDGMGQLLVDKTELTAENADYQETVLKREAGKPATKLERKYTKSQSGKPDLEDTPLKGQTVVIEKKGAKFGFALKDGGELVEAARKTLEKEFAKKDENSSDMQKLVLPAQAVKAGESWDIKMPKIVAEFSKEGLELNAAKSTGKGTLVKTYKRNGMLFGEMKFTMHLPLVSIGKGKEQLKFGDDGKIAIDLTLDTCIDGTSEIGTMKTKMVMSGTAAIAAAPGAQAMMNVTAEGTQIQEDVPKK